MSLPRCIDPSELIVYQHLNLLSIEDSMTSFQLVGQ